MVRNTINRSYLYLIPSFLSDTNDKDHFSAYNRDIIQTIDLFIVENLRTARRFLRKIGFKGEFKEDMMVKLNNKTDSAEVLAMLEERRIGYQIGLVSEAGVPCVADPGANVVMHAHQLDIQVVPLSGPSSIILALMASGFNGQQFTFHGYLPRERKSREQELRKLEKRAKEINETQIFIETPYRNQHLFESILKVCSDSTQLCIASDITSEKEESIKTWTISEWKKNVPELNKKPAVFLIN